MLAVSTNKGETMQQLASQHSLEEVFKDIETSEGVKLSGPEDMTGRFRSLCADIHSSPIDGDSSVDDPNELTQLWLYCPIPKE